MSSRPSAAEVANARPTIICAGYKYSRLTVQRLTLLLEQLMLSSRSFRLLDLGAIPFISFYALLQFRCFCLFPSKSCQSMIFLSLCIPHFPLDLTGASTLLYSQSGVRSIHLQKRAPRALPCRISMEILVFQVLLKPLPIAPSQDVGVPKLASESAGYRLPAC